MPTMIGSNAIGGGFVRISFTDGTERLKPGTPLTAEKIKSWHNHQRLISNDMIAVYPPSGPSADLPKERHIISRGYGHYDVIEGRKLNDKVLTKAEAEALADQPC